MERLDLFVNDLLDGPIPDSIGNLTSLVSLNLFETKISGPIPSSIGNLSSLVELALYQMKISGPIPDSIGDLANLQNVLLAGCALSGPIPKTLVKLKKLEAVSLSNNNLTGDISIIANLSKTVVYLGLEQNNFVGEIPPLFDHLPDLNELYLQGNRLTGPIPDEPRTEAVLMLGQNRLNGTIPRGLCESSHLVQLGLGGNTLSGEIPDCIRNLTNLETFDLSGNELTGTFPDVLAAPQLESFAVNRNYLSGPVPTRSLGVANNTLRHLNIGHNLFNGTVPDILCRLPKLEFLMMPRNRLSGGLPACFFEEASLPSLRLLSLACQSTIESDVDELSLYTRCPTSFHLGDTDNSTNQTVGELITTNQLMTRVDLVPFPELNLDGEQTPPASIMPETTAALVSARSAVVTVIAALVSLAVLGAGVLGRNSGRFSLLDRVPQFGIVQDTVQGSVQRHEYIAQPKEARSQMGGIFNIVKLAALVYFIVNSIATFCLSGMVLDESTVPAADFVKPGALNFTLHARASGTHLSDKPMLLGVEDRWLSQQLRFNGHASLAESAVAASISDDGTQFSFPVGWDPQNLTRSVTLSLSTALIRELQLNWTLEAGSIFTGVPPGGAATAPSVSGGMWAVPVDTQTCARYPRYYKKSRVTILVDYRCEELEDTPQLEIPGRASPESLYGPERLVCVEELTVVVLATPTTQTVPEDFFAGTQASERKTFTLTFEGADTRMHKNLVLPGMWQNYPESCPGCIEATACPPTTKLTVVLKLDTFGVTQVLNRSQDPLSFGPALLASCLSIGAVFVSVYNAIDAWSRKKARMQKWLAAAKSAITVGSLGLDNLDTNGAIAARKALLGRKTGGALGDFCICSAPTSLGSRRPHPVHEDDDELLLLELDDGNVGGSVGRFMLLVLGRDGEVAEYTFEVGAAKLLAYSVKVTGLGSRPKEFRGLKKALKYFANPNVFPRPPAPLFNLVGLDALTQKDVDGDDGDNIDSGDGMLLAPSSYHTGHTRLSSHHHPSFESSSVVELQMDFYGGGNDKLV